MANIPKFSLKRIQLCEFQILVLIVEQLYAYGVCAHVSCKRAQPPFGVRSIQSDHIWLELAAPSKLKWMLGGVVQSPRSRSEALATSLIAMYV